MDDTSSESVKVVCRFRPEGLDLLVKQLILKGEGFIGLTHPLIHLVDDEVVITVSMNIGVGSRDREYFALEFDVPAAEFVKKYNALNAAELKKEHDEIDAIGKDMKGAIMVAPGIFVAEKSSSIFVTQDEVKDDSHGPPVVSGSDSVAAV